MDKKLSGEILVASRIVDYLSSGLYESPAACLKELVNNAYDADATRVELFVKPDANRIIVTDNGSGMDSDDFKRNFSKISESFKRETSDTTPSLRPKIGKIGIGFIAANEICDVMQIISTKKGSKEKINIEINFHAMRLPPEERKKPDSSYTKADYEGTVTEADPEEHYTHIFLKDVRGPAQELLAGARSSGGTGSLYGLSHEAIAERLRDPNLRSWEDFDFYSRTMLEVALNVPVRYVKNWASHKHSEQLKTFTTEVANLNFEVIFDGTELLKPTVLHGTDRSFVQKFSHKGKHVSFRSYFYVQHGVLNPQDLNGVLIRIRNSAVGKYERGFLGFPNSTGTLFQRWISSEVWADDHLEHAMNIDRKTLRVTHPAYLELVDAYHAQLRKVLVNARDVLYEQPAKARKQIRQAEDRRTIEKVAQAAKKVASDAVANQINLPSNYRKILRKYSGAELIDLVVRVANETLPPTQRKTFIDALIAAVLKK